MGSKLSRSSSSTQSEGSKRRWRRGKRKRLEIMETSVEVDKFLAENNHERQNSNAVNLNDTYEKWDKRIDQQELPNYNDPPGAPSTYSPNYAVPQNDPRERTWSSPQDISNQFYQGNSLPMGAASSVSYDLNQYPPAQIPAIFNNQSQQVPLEERPSKKVQFARHVQQQQSPSKTPLTNTHSWHEPSVTTNETSVTITRQEPTLTRQSVHRSAMHISNPSSIPVSVQKPIYVGIDHQATLAERGQTAIHRRHHKSNDKNNSDSSVTNSNNHRTRSHTHHQHKHQDANDISSSKPRVNSNKSFERFQAKLSSTNRTVTTTSTSTIIANKQVQHAEQPMFSDVDMKMSKTRGTRQTQAQHVEQQTLVDNEVRPSRGKGNHSQQKSQQQQQQQQPPPSQQQHHQQQQQQRAVASRNNSPLRTDTTRRLDNKHHNAPIMKIPISQQQQQQQQRQKQSSMPSAVVTTPTVTRTRV